jgi:hypothetical protein
MVLIFNELEVAGLHKKHVVATANLGTIFQFV